MGAGADPAPGAMDFLADTVFLIDLWRESRSPGPATAFARTHAGDQVAICWVAAGEFMGGAAAADQDVDLVSAFLSRYPILHSDPAVIRNYAEIFAHLRAGKQMIGPNDLWIAASARAHGLPLLTRNVDEFDRVEGLEVVDYTQPG